jgi:His/Glu/Gln/Arg/opine family amino acid ABC transporter permease subunit
MMNKQLLFVVLACLGFVSAGRSDDSLERVRKAGKLVVAIDPTYPPMEFEKDGKPQGFDIDLATKLAERLGVKAEFISMDWSGIIAGLNSRRYDIIISSMSITPERKKEMRFVEYASMGQVFVTQHGLMVRTPEELEGKIVAVQSDTTSFSWVEKQRKRGIAIKEVRDFRDATDTFNALKSGQAEVVVTDEPVGLYYTRQDSTFAVTGQAMEPQPIGIALHKDDRELRSAVALAIEDMEFDGTIKELSERWFGTELGQEPGTIAPTESPSFLRFSLDTVLPRLGQGIQLTLLLTALCGVGGIGIGLFVSLARISRNWFISKAALVYVTLFRGTPLLLQIFFVFYALPSLGLRLGALAAGVLALSLNASAYVAEIFRAAIQSIDRGQMEAARALGMSHGLAMRRVILPQTFRRLVPPLVNELAALSKDTSLVSVLALHEMLYQTNRLAATYLRPWDVYLWAALGYLAIVLTLTWLAGRLEKRLEAKGA